MNCNCMIPIIDLDKLDDAGPAGEIKPEPVVSIPSTEIIRVISEMHDELNATEKQSQDGEDEREEYYYIGVDVGLQVGINKLNDLLKK